MPSQALLANLSRNLQNFDVMEKDPEVPDQVVEIAMPEKDVKEISSIVDVGGNPLRSS